MLIPDKIKKALAAGKLVQAKPVVPWAGEPRAFLMCQPLYLAIQEGKVLPTEGERKPWAALEVAISHFIEGGLVTEKLLKQLVPKKYEHWELISRRPRPSIRVFGRFYCPDVFVGTHLKLRKWLGGMGSPQFEHEMLVCEDHWNECELGEPFTDKPLFRYEEYITSNATRKIRGPL